jgi:hypothetical protein
MATSSDFRRAPSRLRLGAQLSSGIQNFHSWKPKVLSGCSGKVTRLNSSAS